MNDNREIFEVPEDSEVYENPRRQILALTVFITHSCIKN